MSSPADKKATNDDEARLRAAVEEELARQRLQLDAQLQKRRERATARKAAAAEKSENATNDDKSHKKAPLETPSEKEPIDQEAAHVDAPADFQVKLGSSMEDRLAARRRGLAARRPAAASAFAESESALAASKLELRKKEAKGGAGKGTHFTGVDHDLEDGPGADRH
jgi:hypothetical protein